MVSIAQCVLKVKEDGFDQARIVDDYKAWVALDKVLLLQKTIEGKSIFMTVPAAKRGNEWYIKRTRSRFEDKVGHIPDYEYFSRRSRDVEKTDLIFVTMTYEKQDPQNWIDNGKHFQEFANRMRSTYGKIEFIRVWESHSSGFPHCHAVIRLPRSVYCRNIGGIWRVVGKPYRQIKSYWTHGFSDVRALNGTHQVVNYLVKYVMKTAVGEEADKHVTTLAMLWFFRKRAFSISKVFFEDARTPGAAQPPDLNSTMHNSYQKFLTGGHAEFPEENSGVIEHLHGLEADVPWTFIGVMTPGEAEAYIQDVKTWESEALRGDNLALASFKN